MTPEACIFCSNMNALMAGSTLKKKTGQMYYIKWQYGIPIIYSFVRKTDHGNILSYAFNLRFDGVFDLFSDPDFQIIDLPIEKIVEYDE